MKILYSYAKGGFEADYWHREIRASSGVDVEFIPFNHQPYLHPQRYIRAQLLDNLYFERDPGLLRMYADFESALASSGADAVVVDTCAPYHPEYLRTLGIFKALRIADGPISAYDRDFAYIHAYDQILYHSPAYSRDLGMAEKLAYCRAREAQLWPLCLFDAGFDANKSETELLTQERDIDVIFIGALHLNKMPLLAKVKRAFGRRCRIHGLTTAKRNAYFNARYGFPGWIRPVDFKEYVPLYQRSRIGINVHNRGDYTVGSYRLFDLPGNGVMQISDGGDYLNEFFDVGNEIVAHTGADDLIDKVRYYLSHDEERLRIAGNAYRRVMADHRVQRRMGELGHLVRAGMARAATYASVVRCPS